MHLLLFKGEKKMNTYDMRGIYFLVNSNMIFKVYHVSTLQARKQRLGEFKVHSQGDRGPGFLTGRGLF